MNKHLKPLPPDLLGDIRVSPSGRMTRSHFLRSVSLVAVLAMPAAAQCSLSWTSGSPLSASDGRIAGIVEWDPDGSGSATPVLVFAGSFGAIGNIAANNIASFDVQTGSWAPLGSGLLGIQSYEVVHAITVFQGDIVVAGRITVAGGVPVNGIARWNGTSWSSLGTNLDGVVRSLFVDGTSLVAGGLGLTSGGIPLNGIARWNGTAWTSIGGGIGGVIGPAGDVFAIGADAGGALVAGGSGTGGVSRFDGTTWTSLGTGLVGPGVEDIATWNGNLIAVSGNAPFTWNGAFWVPLGALSGVVRLAVVGGSLFAVGDFLLPFGGVAQWNGVSWESLESPDRGCSVIAGISFPVASSGLVAVGYGPDNHETLRRFSNTATNTTNNWPSLNPGGTNGTILASAVLSNGDVVVGGEFSEIGGVAANGIARWNGSAWSSLGAGVNSRVNALLALPNGDLVVGGSFTTAGGVSANRIARFTTGGAWASFASGFNDTVYALAPSPDPNFEFIVGGNFTARVAFWNQGTGNFASYGAALNGEVRALTVAPNGDIFVGGLFTQLGSTTLNHVARLRVSSSPWSAMGNGVNGDVWALTMLRNGDLVVGGNFTFAGFAVAEKIARWNGSTWSTLGAGMLPAGATSYGPHVTALTTLPNGDLLVGGKFESAGGVPGTQNMARWDGSNWSVVAINGTVSDAPSAVPPASFTMLRDGDLLVTGAFTRIGSLGVGRFARLGSSCQAIGDSYDPPVTTCVGGAGPVSLEMTSRPWVGSTYQSRSTGLLSNAQAFTLLGFQRQMPAAPLGGSSGCVLSTSIDQVSELAPAVGSPLSVTFSLPLPLNPALVGVMFFEQTLVLDRDASGTVVAATTSNALKLRVGAF